MNNNYEKAKEMLKKYKQEHIIKFIDNSNSEIKNKLIEQVLSIDFEELKELYNKTFEDLYVDLEELKPIVGVNPDKLANEELEKYEEKGTDIIKNNKFAVATMAGRSRNKASDIQELKVHLRLNLKLAENICLKL